MAPSASKIQFDLPWPEAAEVLTASRALAQQDHVSFLLGAKLSWSPRPRSAIAQGGVGWGRNPRNEALRQICERRDLPFLYLEDPYFRSWGLSRQSFASPAVGLMLDTRKPAYDCTGQGSFAEHRLAQRMADAADQPPDTLRKFIVAARLTKYNFAPPSASHAQKRTRPGIGVIDQVQADRSLLFGGAGDLAMQQLCADAIKLARQQDATLVLRSHPDVRAGKSGPALSRLLIEQCRLHNMPLVHSDIQSPHDFLDDVDTVLTLTSGLGFEALLKAKHVVSFGAPFYAGWGLTEDRAQQAEAVTALKRRAAGLPVATLQPSEKLRRLDLLVTTMLEELTLWWDPVHRQRCDALHALKRLASWTTMETAGDKPAKIYGIASWKRKAVTAMVAGPGSNISYSLWAAPGQAVANVQDYVWGNPTTVRAQSDVTRIEDGFIRSIGLGAQFVSPASLVFDPLGLHYAADRPSRIETILQNGTGMTDALVDRARMLRQRITQAGIDKYNLSASGGPPPDTKPLHLVIGQVIDDESVRQGRVETLPGHPLVQRVRQQHPSATIAYRPHPDVMAGLRKGDTSSPDANEMASSGSLAAWFAVTERLHVATSLAGFEALLRGVPVSTYGLPFYAGWGLTDDAVRSARRTRSVTLDELVAATLILYPRYASILTGLRCEPEDILDEIEAIRQGLVPAPPPPKPSSMARKLVVAVARKTGLRI